MQSLRSNYSSFSAVRTLFNAPCIFLNGGYTFLHGRCRFPHVSGRLVKGSYIFFDLRHILLCFGPSVVRRVGRKNIESIRRAREDDVNIAQNDLPFFNAQGVRRKEAELRVNGDVVKFQHIASVAEIAPDGIKTEREVRAFAGAERAVREYIFRVAVAFHSDIQGNETGKVYTL